MEAEGKERHSSGNTYRYIYFHASLHLDFFETPPRISAPVLALGKRDVTGKT